MPIATHTTDNPREFERQLNKVRHEKSKKVLGADYKNDANAAEVTVLVEKLMENIYTILAEIKSEMAKENTVKSEAEAMRELMNKMKLQSGEERE